MARRVVLIHDAAIDEYICTVLLTAMPSIDLVGIIIVNADCIAEPALEAASKLQQFLGITDIPLALSRARTWNPFPWEYRGDCVKFSSIPSLQPFSARVPSPPPDGEELLSHLLRRAIADENPLTLLMTGPLTPLTDVCARYPALAKGVGTIVWMGGAINVPGNLDPHTVSSAVANKYAEWNAFCDPFAVEIVLRNFDDTHLFPLDITDCVPIDKDFLLSLEQQSTLYPYSRLAFEAYSLVASEAYYEMWDVTTACWLGRPELYMAPKIMELEIETWGFNQGWIRPTSASRKDSLGQRVFLNFADKAAFYQYVLKLLQLPALNQLDPGSR